MKVSAWLVLELVPPRYTSQPWGARIVASRKSRPLDALAVHVTLDLDPDLLLPHVEALVGSGHLSLSLSEIEPEAEVFDVPA